jgi:tRNA (cmo5U34)-methyltransferase
MTTFSDPSMVSSYAERTAKIVPGLLDLHKMVGVVLAEQAPAHANVLVLGAGGGLELKTLAEMHASWVFTGVDPSAEMLALARITTAHYESRISLHEGYIQDAPKGPFDAATCLLTLHFLPSNERLITLKELQRRLKPGASLVIVQHSFPNQGAEMDKWLRRNAAFAVANGMQLSQAEHNGSAIKERLPVLTPAQDEELLDLAGFENIEMFYCGFTFKGWVAYKPL